MSPKSARWLLLIFGLILPALLIIIWLTQPPSVEPTRSRPKVATIPQYLLPKITLPMGSDPDSVALRRALKNGERVYQQLCHHCHGRQGRGDQNVYMERQGHKPADHSDLHEMQKLSDQAFFRALRDGVKDDRGWFTMPPWESVLSERDMWDVIVYVRHLPRAVSPSDRAPD